MGVNWFIAVEKMDGQSNHEANQKTQHEEKADETNLSLSQKSDRDGNNKE
jgi:hypothetical protein